MSNSTFVSIGISEGEVSPGKSKELALMAESSTDVSSVSGSDGDTDSNEGVTDLFIDRISERDDVVDGEGGACDCNGSGPGDAINGRKNPELSWGRKGVDRVADLRPSNWGVKLGLGASDGIDKSSRCSIRKTRVQRCFQISSESRGPGSSISSGGSDEEFVVGVKIM